MTSSDRPEECAQNAQMCLQATSRAGDLLIEATTAQILPKSRLAATSKLSTHLSAASWRGNSHEKPLLPHSTGRVPSIFATSPFPGARSRPRKANSDGTSSMPSWRGVAGKAFRSEVGPLVEFRHGALPDWIWLWEGDSETIGSLVADFVQQTIQRYKGQVPLWHVVHRPAGSEILGLTEEEQIRITARAIQAARQSDPSAQFTIGIDRPWAEWMGTSHFQLGPLHLCDYLLRADLGLAGVAIEIAPGYSSPGSYMRDLFEFSKLLDLYSLLNVPLFVWLALPSADGPDPNADSSVQLESGQWPQPIDESLQAAWGAKWVALAVSKPFVRTVSWLQASDAAPHLYPHAGLLRPNQTHKPLLSWLKMLRKETLA